MLRREISREELFSMVWERPTQEVAKELGVSAGKRDRRRRNRQALRARLQVPKPPRGYWARVRSGQTPRRPPIYAFREDLERRRREAARAEAAEVLTKLQQQFWGVALSDLR